MLEVVKASLESGEGGEGGGEDRLAQLKAEKKERLAKALAERCHPLEGYKVNQKGKMKTKVRTMSGRKLVVENSQLVECDKAVAKRDKEKAKADAAAKTAAAGSDTPRTEKKSGACHIL